MCFVGNTRGLTFTTSWYASNDAAILGLENKSKREGFRDPKYSGSNGWCYGQIYFHKPIPVSPETPSQVNKAPKNKWIFRLWGFFQAPNSGAT